MVHPTLRKAMDGPSRKSPGHLLWMTGTFPDGCARLGKQAHGLLGCLNGLLQHLEGLTAFLDDVDLTGLHVVDELSAHVVDLANGAVGLHRADASSVSHIEGLGEVGLQVVGVDLDGGNVLVGLVLVVRNHAERALTLEFGLHLVAHQCNVCELSVVDQLEIVDDDLVAIASLAL